MSRRFLPLLIAVACLSRSITASAQTPELDRATTLHEQAVALQQQRKYADAMALLAQSLAIREKHLGPNHADVAVSLTMIGLVHYYQKDLPAAEMQLDRALRIWRTAAEVEPQEIAQGLAHVAMVYQAQGRLREAEPLLVEASAIHARAGATVADRSAVINNLAMLLLQRGDFARARDQFRRALARSTGALGPSHSSVARIANNLGLALQGLGNFAEAEAMFRRSVAIRKQGKDPLELAKGLQNLAQAIHEQGRLDEAEGLYHQALTIFRTASQEESADAAQAMNNLAVLYLLKKDPERAGPLYERARALREKTLGPNHPDVASTLLLYAIYLYDRQRVGEAIAAYSRGSEINERNIASILEVGSEAQKQRYLQTYNDGNDVMLWLRSQAQSAAADRTALLTLLRRKGRIQEVLAASTDALRTSGASPAVVDELRRVRAELARLVLQGGADTPERNLTIQRLEEREDTLEAQLSAATADRRPERDFTIETLQARIPDDAVLLEFFRYRPFDPTATRVTERFGAPKYVAMALGRTGPPQWAELGDADRIDGRITTYRRVLANRSRADVADRAAELSPLLTSAIQRLAGDASQILVSPDGALNLLPFQTLVGDDGRFLVERYDFTYLTSGRDLLRPASANSPGAPLVVANPAFGTPSASAGALNSSFKPLPATAAEASALASLLTGAQILDGARATEAAVKQARRPAVLHIATHGFFLTGTARDAAPGTRGFQSSSLSSRGVTQIPPLLRSGLAFAGANLRRRPGSEDGILTASEAAMLDLNGTELVFLSACESGLGVVNSGESVYGLRRAFVIAGARSQVLTLWQVSDEETKTFVVEFYKQLSGGAARSVALRNAQRQALADGHRRHPFYWAAFILSGDAGPLRIGAR